MFSYIRSVCICRCFWDRAIKRGRRSSEPLQRPVTHSVHAHSAGQKMTLQSWWVPAAVHRLMPTHYKCAHILKNVHCSNGKETIYSCHVVIWCDGGPLTGGLSTTLSNSMHHCVHTSSPLVLMSWPLLQRKMLFLPCKIMAYIRLRPFYKLIGLT